MKKRILALAAAVALMLTLSACGGQSSSKPKTEAGIKSDLIESKEDFFGLFDIHCHDLDGNFGTDYTIDSLTIDRRKSDLTAGTDDVYITVVTNNMATKFTGAFHLLYSLYDVGGWYLESIELESGTYEPLDELTDEQIIYDLSSSFYELGASESDFTVVEKTVNENDASVTVSLDFSDGIIAVQGPIDLNYFHDGVSWTWDYNYYDSLSYDILAEGTYKATPDYNRNAPYLVVDHENGELVVLAGLARNGAYFDSFGAPDDWTFNCVTRSYERINIYGTVSRYCFTPEGMIDFYSDGELLNTFTKVAEPITDIEALTAYALEHR